MLTPFLVWRITELALWLSHVASLLVVSVWLDDVQAVADLMRSRNSQGGRLRDLLQVITGDSTPEDDDPSVDGDPDGAQCPVAGRTQGAFDSFGQAVVFQALRKERGGRLGSVLFLVGVLTAWAGSGAWRTGPWTVPLTHSTRSPG